MQAFYFLLARKNKILFGKNFESLPKQLIVFASKKILKPRQEFFSINFDTKK
jgi:hypothetical protein